MGIPPEQSLETAKAVKVGQQLHFPSSPTVYFLDLMRLEHCPLFYIHDCNLRKFKVIYLKGILRKCLIV